LASHLGPELLRELLTAARGIADDCDRAAALGVLALELEEPARTDTLREALMAARSIESKPPRADVLICLARQLPSFGACLWTETLLALTLRSRRDLLSDLTELSPLFPALAGPRGGG
jgi:hypothetical protein